MATQLYESNDGGLQNDATGVYGANWLASAFTASPNNHNITSIKIRIYRTGSPGNITVSLRASAGTTPTGSDLATSNTVDGNGLGTSLPGAMTEFTFASPYTVTNGTEYWIVVRATSGSAGNQVNWVKNTNASTGETATSTDSGANWSAYETKVGLYENYGDAPLTYPSTLSQGSFTLTGKSIGVRKVFATVSLAVGSIALTGYDLIVSIIRKWIPESKNTSTFTNGSKNSSSWTNESKNTSAFTNEEKN